MSRLLHRRDVVRVLLEDRGGMLVVGGLGAPAWDITSTGDHPLSFPMWGAMGGAAMIGLGLALAQPKLKVAVVTGDGEMLMGMGSLATIGVKQPKNLAVVVFDNGFYGETGMQESHTSGGIDLCEVARGCGIAQILEVDDDSGLRRLSELIRTGEGPLFARVRISPDEPPRVLPEKDGIAIKQRVRKAVERANSV